MIRSTPIAQREVEAVAAAAAAVGTEPARAVDVDEALPLLRAVRAGAGVRVGHGRLQRRQQLLVLPV